MPGRPLIYIEDSNGDIKACIVGFTVILCICMFMLSIWSMFHFQKYHPGPPDTRTWEQKYKDKAFSECQYNTEDPVKIEKCYTTIYGVPSPDYQPAVAH